MTTKKNGAFRYIYAYDPQLKRQAVHVVLDGYAISLLSRNKFKYSPKA